MRFFCVLGESPSPVFCGDGAEVRVSEVRCGEVEEEQGR